MKRRTFLRRLAAGGCAALSGRFARPDLNRPLDKPNIVLVLIDDLGWADLGCYGNGYCETPNLDRLAAEGTRFTQAYAACAVCSPTRAALLTGRYPTRVGITDWIRARFQRGHEAAAREDGDGYVSSPGQSFLCPKNPYCMPLEEVTLAEALKSGGYTTWHVGKWHLGDPGFFPEEQGFDVNIGGCDFGHPPSYFAPFVREGQGEIPSLHVRREGEYLTDRLAEEAAHLIRAHEHGPFFLYLSHYTVHNPLQAPEELVQKYKAKPDTDGTNPIYAAMIERMDASIGAIRRALADKGFADNTVIVFTSDNGGLVPNTQNGILREGKGTPYEGGLRVPAIVHWPGVVTAGAVKDTPIISMDFFSTLCAAGGVAVPPDRPIDGRNLLPLLRDRDRIAGEPFCWHFPHYRNKTQGPYSVIRHEDWKLIRSYDSAALELYQLADDPSEEYNLASSMPEKAAQLDKSLSAWLEATGAKLPKAAHDYAHLH